jgi:hypothetical protein
LALKRWIGFLVHPIEPAMMFVRFLVHSELSQYWIVFLKYLVTVSHWIISTEEVNA